MGTGQSSLGSKNRLEPHHDDFTLFSKTITVEELNAALSANPERIRDICSLSGAFGEKSFYSSIGYPLHAACIYGRRDIVEVLLQHKAPVNYQYLV
jgi:hypothetical protein